ncbi:MAG: 4-(cytidine 5'-diphospho)-2-C-methyl-D-erythritol kinase [Acidobacteria bacterium]|nr:MAG: 4-(cytidine 5'-diphospho)-2-C-methyl-D-erythritol kinase [Acidobacteriota bacterium]
MSFTLPSFAKINLHLEVLGKRDDGFHELLTVFQTVSLCDELTFETGVDEIELVSDDPKLPANDKNLIISAANELKSRFDVKLGARIGLVKRIPMGGGLGGGSSNAAVTLIGLSQLWRLNASLNQLGSIAEKLGSDVPFFLHGGTAIGSGRGEIIHPMADFPDKYLIIVTPSVHVSTSRAFEELHAPNLTKEGANRILNVSCAAEILPGELKSDFEKTVFAAFPEIGNAKTRLLDLGARRALMSGSGASVFGIFDNEETRQTALKALGQETDWRRFAVAAVSRNEYREKLEIGN